MYILSLGPLREAKAEFKLGENLGAGARAELGVRITGLLHMA